jgi:hypothetical protein
MVLWNHGNKRSSRIDIGKIIDIEEYLEQTVHGGPPRVSTSVVAT